MFKVNDNILMCTRKGVMKGVVAHVDSRCGEFLVRWDNEVVEHLTQFDVSRRAIRLADEEEICCNCKYRLHALTGSCPSDRFIVSPQERIAEDASAGRID